MIDLKKRPLSVLPSIQRDPFEQADLLQQPIFRRALNDSSGPRAMLFLNNRCKVHVLRTMLSYILLSSHILRQKFLWLHLINR